MNTPTEQTALTRWTDDADQLAIVWKKLSIPLQSVLGTQRDPSRDVSFVFGTLLDMEWPDGGFAWPKAGQAVLDYAPTCWAQVDMEKYPSSALFVIGVEALIEQWKRAKNTPKPPAKPAALPPAAYSDDVDVALGRKDAPLPPANDVNMANEPENEVKPMQTEPAPKPIAPVTNLDNLAEAPFSATVKIWHKQYNVEVLLTVRSTTVNDGMKRLETTLDHALGEGGKYAANRPANPAPSTAERRVSADNAPAQVPSAPPAQAAVQSPVRSYDPDAAKPDTGPLTVKIFQIEKVFADDGRVQINLYKPLPNGGEAKWPEFYLKSDADLEEVYKFMDVEKMQPKQRYAFNATVEYVLSTKLNSKGNPYKNLRRIVPDAAAVKAA